ncbi:paxillin-like [Homalodisca vitripennis]|uniref:paxillin-like n=1 Tax=Homalodisca vitripennis TaxID=197043 RepID=UPI001EEADBCF|nr:paxillin-like [Homalodisca vitripennis]
MSTVNIVKPATTTVECASCHQPIADMIVQAMDKSWHQEHFVCTHCKQPITSQRFHVYDNQPYCEVDYTELFLKKCTVCGEPIKDVVVMALAKPWHKECFNCTDCSAALSQNGYHEEDGKPYCQHCFEVKFCPRCKLCEKPIVDTSVIALGDKYHPGCFRCSKCDEPVLDRTFKMIKGVQVCSNCDKH